MDPFEEEEEEAEEEEEEADEEEADVDDEEADEEEDRAGVWGRGALKRSLMLLQSMSRALLGTASLPSPASMHGMRRTMLSMARAYASPSCDSSDRNAETTDAVEVEVEVEVEELLVGESVESAAWIKEDTRERADAKGANVSSGYPLLHSKLSAAMLNRPTMHVCMCVCVKIRKKRRVCVCVCVRM